MTHCPKGHLITKANTLKWRVVGSPGSCRKCQNINNQNSRDRLKEKQNETAS